MQSNLQLCRKYSRSCEKRYSHMKVCSSHGMVNMNASQGDAISVSKDAVRGVDVGGFQMHREVAMVTYGGSFRLNCF